MDDLICGSLAKFEQGSFQIKFSCSRDYSDWSMESKWANYDMAGAMFRSERVQYRFNYSFVV
jgi:hypothetical protein